MSEAYSAHHLSNPNSPSATPATMSNSQEGTSPIHEIELSESEYEGDSALSAHTAFATKFLENVVGQDVASMYKQPSSFNRQDQVPGISSLPLPPAQIAFNCLRLAREAHMDMWAFELESLDQFQEYFLNVYCSSHPTAAEQIIILAAFTWLFSCCSSVNSIPSQREEFEKQAMTCDKSLETAITRLPFHLPTTFDYVLALSMASQYCIEHHRPMMAWNLNCTAARMSQALGFHKACMQDPARSIERRRKARLFASIYRTDKMFSLRLGRGSMIRDEEIPLDYKEMLNGVNTAPYKLAPYWIGFAHIQGLVYDKLYSPRALQQPQEVRYSHARKILDELEILLAEKCELKEQFNRSLCTVVGNDLQEILERGDRVSQLALKCLIYRGVSSSARGVPFHEECISLAREALMEHRRCISSLAQHESSNVELYMHWAILSSPFVPFIVILCNVVETRNLADLELLRIMAGSIEELGESLPAVLMQLKVFQPLYEAANKFIRAKTSSTPQTDDFGSFFQETNTGVLLDPTFLSSATQNDHHNGARDAGKNYLDASFLDIWTQLDSYQLNVHMAQEEQSKGP
ncbi:fungal specific transcription factor [Colletotrichum truncatum]|uniref:Fungal specific transcription factor n=1 Tax=Colletotrichum truncatum TaxID=5467 RepID=A0ACC3Z3C6_COLTU